MFSIQISCIAKKPSETHISADMGWGCYIPGALFFRLEMSNPSTRLSDYRRLRTRVVSALRQGDNAYIHCLAWVHNAFVGPPF